MIQVTLYRLKHKGGTKFYNGLWVNGPGVNATVFNWGPVGKDGQKQVVESLGDIEVEKKLTEKKARGYLVDDPAVRLRASGLADIASQIDRLSSPDVRRCWNALPPWIMQKLNNGVEVTIPSHETSFKTRPPEPTRIPEPERPSATKTNPNYGMFA